jgi:ABC-type glycerol-3-phosphate transport system permease component
MNSEKSYAAESAENSSARFSPENVAKIGTVFKYVTVIFLIITLMVPLVWMLSTAFKPLEDAFAVPPQIIPEVATLDNFRANLGNPSLVRYFINSLIVAAFSALIATFAGACAAYGLSRFRFKGNEAVSLFFLSSMAFPIPLLMISMYIIYAKVHLLNSYISVVLGHSVITLPVAVWLLKGYFDTLPIEVEEAAHMDGSSPFRTLVTIVMPMAKPAMAAAAIFIFVVSWNELMMALAFITTDARRTLPPGITMNFLQEYESAWTEMMALSVIVALPILALFLFFQKTFMLGVTAGAVKE